MSKHLRLNQARRKLNLTQKEVASKLSIAVSTYRHWEKDTEPNSLSAVERLCSVLQISTTWYITGKQMESLTDDEKAVIEWLRKLPEEKRNAVLKFIEK